MTGGGEEEKVSGGLFVGDRLLVTRPGMIAVGAVEATQLGGFAARRRHQLVVGETSATNAQPWLEEPGDEEAARGCFRENSKGLLRKRHKMMS